ncbi:PREDICTED: WD repeat and HMG-box DNA-binding protein 1 [Papilio polytes]|uniref:WD repeat and HMG-box DNA-binding protein 1 n=1 Tax=Papilio polytes TaxID=76194 RepID=UPI000675C229|nr:PREDICTED: WD repeat and HMG-box DNA-binding protein 1 [Papilio polytes]XP_013135280.1 PREDICTED: WD repeat and HMG-box DNA-binding protein 1 [Papilio polytes]XP_013135281.1 PREDICTED: WD repeat and HMG-box DNA-binding protein 1 [Papilio polytes]
MKIESKPLRYAHAEGHTDVCFSEDGQHIITCGHDGDVRIWLGIEDDDPNSHCVGESALAVCFKDKRLYVANDNHAVQAYTFPAFDKDGIVTRFTAPVTQIMSSPQIEVLGCCSENMEAKICNLEGGAPLFVMTEHKGPVLSVAICPHMKYAATACGDELLRIWDIDTQKVVKEVTCVPKINTFYAAKVLCRISFEPSEGKYLAYPSNREIILLDCESWGQRLTFTHSLIKCAISQCLFSPCGQYIAGSTVAGQIAVWAVQTGTCIGIIEHPTSHNVSAMAWSPKGNGVLAYCDIAGQLGMLVNCYGQDSSKVNGDSEDVEMVEKDDNEELVDNLIHNYESDDDNAISLEKLKNETLGLHTEEFRPQSQLAAPAPAGVPPQPPFQPSATPAHLEHRYMCWNDVGIVRCHTAENGESSIDIEFHDSSLHHGINLNNYLNHTMASLSSTVLALACETPSKLVCISLMGSSKEWSIAMPDTEEILCVSASSALVACATDARLLRLFTTMGTQRQVISLPGPAVALSGFNTTILAVYHSTDPGLSDQHLAMDIIALNGRQVRSKTVHLPLTPGSRLAWLGCTDVGSPCTYDTAGVLRLYDIASGIWIPVCDINTHAKGASDSWFIVSISEPTQTVRVILCRGTSYPLTVPRPIVTEIPLQIPVCEVESEKSQYEEQLVRWAHCAADVDVKAARETALKLFALACRSEIEQRGLELMELLKDEKLLPLAAKYASRLGRVHLADKLSDLADRWREAELVVAHTHFQELESQTNDTQEEINSSIIIPQRIKKKVDSVPIKPVPIKSSPMGKRNPFRKQQDTIKSAQNPLSLTDRTLVEVHTNPESTENNDPLTPLEGETFVIWFSRNKSTLEEQHPELTPSELTRQGVRMFKSIQNVPEGPQKRKLEDSTDGSPVNAPKQSKLSAFAFQKK